MNIAKAFVDYLVEYQSLGAFGTDIFIGSLPDDAPDACYWVTSAGGNSQSKNVTGERIKTYLLNVYYRNTDGEEVYTSIQELEENLNNSLVTSLGDYTVHDVSAVSFPVDRDLDIQERSVGQIQVSIEVYQ